MHLQPPPPGYWYTYLFLLSDRSTSPTRNHSFSVFAKSIGPCKHVFIPSPSLTPEEGGGGERNHCQYGAELIKSQTRNGMPQMMLFYFRARRWRRRVRVSRPTVSQYHLLPLRCCFYAMHHIPRITPPSSTTCLYKCENPLKRQEREGTKTKQDYGIGIVVYISSRTLGRKLNPPISTLVSVLNGDYIYIAG